MKNKKLKTALGISLITIIMASAVFWLNFDVKLNFGISKKKNLATLVNKKYDSNITESYEAIFKDKDALYSYVKKFGPKKTIKYLNELSAKFGSCHNVAHKAGHYAYEIYNEKSFKLCGAECHSGCYHGATEAYFNEYGTADLSKNLNLLCGSELNNFFSHQCIHGIGHGLMAWTSYDLPEALKSCDLLDKMQGSCWTGVFMENIVGGMAKTNVDKGGNPEHFTKYLSDDPQYPCNTVEDKYKGSCYFLQTSRMMQLFSGDFKKIADACLKAEKPYQKSCFNSMGRDVGGSYRHNAKGAIVACANAPKGPYRLECLMGAVQDSMWDPTGQDDALSFCKLLTDKEEKDACYNVIFSRAKEIFTSEAELQTFCDKAEKEYQSNCRLITKI